MPLPSAGNPISFSQVNEELGNSAEAKIDLKSASEGLGEDVAPYGLDELQGLSFGRILQSIGYLDYDAQEGDPSVTEDTAAPYVDGQLDLAAGAENIDADITATAENYYNSDGGFSNGDILYLNNTGLTFPDFPNPPGASGLEQDGYLVNKTSNKVFFYTRSTSAVSNVINRAPVAMPTPTLAVVGSSIRVTIPNHETRVVKNYVIQRKTNSGGTFATLATISPSAFGNYSNTSVTTTYDDSSISAGNNYFYKVKATNAFGETAYEVSNPTSENLPVGTTISSTPASPSISVFNDPLADPTTTDSAVGPLITVSITNRVGNSTITESESMAGNFQFAWSTSNDPGESGNDNGGSGFTGGSVSNVNGDIIYIRPKFTEGGRDNNETGTANINVTNNSVSHDKTVSITVSGGLS
jgi:hypothetical protein